MLRLLSDDMGVEPMWAPSTSRRIFSGGMGDETFEFSLAELQSPSNPASPQAVQRLAVVDQLDLSSMEDDFKLDEAKPAAGAPPLAACPICLEPLSDGREDAVLQMPCAKQHMFHRACLVQWLNDNNSCPVCRHCLPTKDEEEEQVPP